MAVLWFSRRLKPAREFLWEPVLRQADLWLPIVIGTVISRAAEAALEITA